MFSFFWAFSGAWVASVGETEWSFISYYEWSLLFLSPVLPKLFLISLPRINLSERQKVVITIRRERKKEGWILRTKGPLIRPFSLSQERIQLVRFLPGGNDREKSLVLCETERDILFFFSLLPREKEGEKRPKIESRVTSTQCSLLPTSPPISILWPFLSLSVTRHRRGQN